MRLGASCRSQKGRLERLILGQEQRLFVRWGSFFLECRHDERCVVGDPKTPPVPTGVGIFNQDGSLTLNGSAFVEDNTSRLSGGGVKSARAARSPLTTPLRRLATRPIFDNDGSGNGGGVRLKSKACLVGAVDGGNVNDNFLGNGTENNITGASVCI